MDPTRQFSNAIPSKIEPNALFQRELCEHFLAYRYSKNDTEDSLH